MSKVVVSEFVTLDGVYEDPGGETEMGGWAFQSDRGDGDAYKFEELKAAGALLLGRRTYEGFARAWPTMEGTGEFGEKMNSMPKYVYSSTLENPEWNNSTVIEGDLGQRITELRDRVEGDILVNGSGQLVTGLTDQGLVDEYRLMVFPTVLGRGKKLFDGVDGTTALRLQSTRQAGETMILTYTQQ